MEQRLEQVVEHRSFLSVQVNLAINCIKDGDDLALFVKGRNDDGPRRKELNVDVLLRSFRSESVHFALLSLEKVFQKFHADCLTGRYSDEAIGTSTVELQNPRESDVCGNRDQNGSRGKKRDLSQRHLG